MQVILLGLVLGFLAKYLDDVLIIGDIGTRLGFWILVATLLAAWSRSPQAAAVHTLVFFISMIGSYYAYSTAIFGFFPKYYFYAWGVFALISPVGAYFVWHARGAGWFAAICASIPISLLLVQGYPFYYTHAVVHGFDLLAAAVLFAILPSSREQRLRTLLPTAGLFLMFYRLDIIALFFGGL